MEISKTLFKKFSNNCNRTADLLSRNKKSQKAILDVRLMSKKNQKAILDYMVIK